MTDCLCFAVTLLGSLQLFKIFVTTPPAMLNIQGKARKLEQYSNAECTVNKE